MKILYTSRWYAEGLDPNDKIFLISIGVPKESKEANLKPGWKNILKIKFDDVDFKEKLVLHEGTPDERKIVPFNEDHANKILDAVSNLDKIIKVVIVHCEAGISRSAGVALFLAEMFHTQIDLSRALPNKLVYTTLKEVYEKRKAISNEST